VCLLPSLFPLTFHDEAHIKSFIPGYFIGYFSHSNPSQDWSFFHHTSFPSINPYVRKIFKMKLSVPVPGDLLNLTWKLSPQDLFHIEIHSVVLYVYRHSKVKKLHMLVGERDE
jgi:hypothetical protein